jgi:transcription-repair coupling factor (superfamily II helicase)
MTKYIAPTHPLIQAFLLQQEVFAEAKNIIVESDTDALKLKNMLEALRNLKKETSKEYQIVNSHNDILRTIHYPETVGIYTTTSALTPPENTDTKNTNLLTLEKGKKSSEKQLIEWLTNNGYETKKMTGDIGTYFRQGDTINITTTHGVLQVSFFGETIEDIYLETRPVESYTLVSLL